MWNIPKGHACVCSCVGPVIDAQLHLVENSYKEKFILMMIIQSHGTFPVGDVCLPTVYDALLVTSASLNFRDGRVCKNCMANLRQYLVGLAANDAYL